MKKIIFKLQFIIWKLTRKSRRGLRVALLASLIVAIFVSLAGIVQAADDTKIETTLVLDTNNPNLLVLKDAKTEIKPGLAKADIDKLNNEHDPEAIKAYMQELEDEYGIDWKLVYAIGYLESGNYTSSLAERQNNFFGRKANSASYASWGTAQEGIRNQFEYLKTRYFDRGLDTPAKINPIYAEDMTWHYKVETVINTI